MRGLLRESGETLVLGLLKANRKHTGSSADVRQRFSISIFTLQQGRDADLVIAYCPPGEVDFIFPLEQFKRAGYHDWARAVIAAVGNGAPALHFIYTVRKSLAGLSFAEALRDGRQQRRVASELVEAANRLTVER